MKPSIVIVLFLVIVTAVSSCKDDEFEEAESFEEIVEQIREQKLNAITEGRECIICNFQDTEAPVYYCEGDLSEDGENTVLQLSAGTVVKLEDITLVEQEEKVRMKATCTRYNQ